MTTLHLRVKEIYFEQIRDGSKTDEYRLATPYWGKRLIEREYDKICVWHGYPKADDWNKQLWFEWNGVRNIRLTHPHFGPEEVEVFAINVSERIKTGLFQNPDGSIKFEDYRAITEVSRQVSEETKAVTEIFNKQRRLRSAI